MTNESTPASQKMAERTCYNCGEKGGAHLEQCPALAVLAPASQPLPAQSKKSNMRNQLIEAGALRQFQRNDGSGLVAGYDIAITNREFARLDAKLRDWQEAYENMKKFAEDNGLDTVTHGPQSTPTGKAEQGEGA